MWAKSCPTLCNPMDCSLPGSFVHGILQVRILEWVAISFSGGSTLLRDQTCVLGFLLWKADSLPLCHLLLLLSCFSRIWLSATPQTAAHQALRPLGFSRQEHWSGLLFPSPKQKSKKWKWSCSVMSDSSRSHGLQPTRLLCPQDFPGKSTYHWLY